MAIRLFRDLELLQSPATVYDITFFSLQVALPNLPLDILPRLFVKVLGEAPGPKLILKLTLSITKSVIIAYSPSGIYKRGIESLGP